MDNDLLWYIYIKPYVLYQGEWMPSNSTAKVSAYCICPGDICPPYDTLRGGELWALYDDPRNGSNSFEVIRDLATEVIAEKGYRLDDIKILAEMNKDMFLIPQY